MLQNPYGIPIPVTFTLQVIDDAGIEGVHIVTVVVQPTSSPVLDMTITQNATDPMAGRRNAGRHRHRRQGTARVVAGDDRHQHVRRLPDVHRGTIRSRRRRSASTRGPGIAIRANVRFQYGGTDLNDGLLVERTLCRDYNLPVLGQAHGERARRR